MELDDFKQAWQTLDRRIEQQRTLSVSMFKDGKLDKARASLRPLILGQAFQLGVGLLFAIWAGLFWAAHLQVAHWLVIGLLVHAYGLLLVISAARNLYLVGRIDYAAPVLLIQRRLAELRAWRARVEAPMNLLLACFAWMPVLLMNLAGYGIDIWAHAPGLMRWMLLSSLVGLGAALALVWAMRRMGQAQRIEDHAVGRSLRRAEALLAEVRRFVED